MPSYTTSLRLIQPATGEYSGSWGTQVNTGITALVDSSIAGTTSITMTAANYTLTTANGASDESRAMFLVLGGTPGAAREVIVPAVSKLYFVTNSTTGGFAQTVKTSAGSGISVPNGASMTLRCDGTNVVVAQNYFASMTLGSALPVASGGTGAATLTGVLKGNGTSAFTASNVNLTSEVTGTLPVANGGTGAATFTANNVLLGNGTSALQVVAPGTAGNILTSNGTTWASSAPASAVSTISFGSTGLTPSTATSGAVSVAGTLATTNGGTGLTSFTSGGVVYASSSSALATGSGLVFDGTNLGIGTTSPAATAGVTLSKTSNVAYEALLPTVASIAFGYNNSGSANAWGAATGTGFFGTPQSVPLTWTIGAVERMRLDSSGNLGLGVTPSAWRSGAKALQVGGFASLNTQQNGTVTLAFGAYESGSNTFSYLTTGDAPTAYSQITGQHRWYTAPSGTAGNAISFTQAMTLDASGRLMVGTTSQDGMLTVVAPASTGYGSFDAASSGFANLNFKSGGTIYAYMGSANAFVTGGTANDFALRSQNALTFATGGATERARIDSSGRLLINATSIATITDSQKFFLATTSETLSGTIARYSANANSPVLGFFKSRGATVGSSAIVGANDTTGQIQFYADTASSLATTAVISSAVDGVVPTAGDILVAGRLTFSTGDNVVSTPVTRLRIDSNGCFLQYQAAESAQNASATLTVADLRAKIITSNAAVTLTLPTGTDLETYTAAYVSNIAFEVVFIATTANAITIAANGNTTVGNLTVSGNTSGVFRFRRTNTNTFTVYRVA